MSRILTLLGAGAIVTLTIALIIIQPRGLNEAWAASGGIRREPHQHHPDDRRIDRTAQ